MCEPLFFPPPPFLFYILYSARIHSSVMARLDQFTHITVYLWTKLDFFSPHLNFELKRELINRGEYVVLA